MDAIMLKKTIEDLTLELTVRKQHHSAAQLTVMRRRKATLNKKLEAMEAASRKPVAGQFNFFLHNRSRGLV